MTDDDAGLLDGSIQRGYVHRCPLPPTLAQIEAQREIDRRQELSRGIARS
jgi:hypothetical protein